MAKSLRSKSKLQAKSVKRKGEFAKYVDARSKRIAEKLAGETKAQEAKKEKKENKEKENESMDVDTNVVADSNSNEKPKVSTSGWRASNSQRYKQSKLKNKVKKKTMKF
ncbi:hypothetical protein KGF56_001006 [Candida oxycetoniae]|uniref:DUF2423 domain-containing protein n=1 Tax=Candida oxycetoniae TaxID=497107 RepID=A0AAI9T0K4_9ASCO|nr:uncharacterized protein KGF56_001006 [Candida oxycetoniae]KAI3406164.2 hypothetical protein KGF56_001006 [Candida oxycetoniae]